MKHCLSILLMLLLAGPICFASDKLTLSTVVIDAGHGGKDPGAVSRDGKSYEKTFTSDIASLLAAKIHEAYPEVKVVQTRSTDKYVTLNDRAAIANKAGADLFISIHINASTNPDANGYSVHVLGQSSKPNSDTYRLNLDMVKRENSVITLDDDYNPESIGFNPSDPESYIFMTMMQSAFLEQSISFAQVIVDELEGGPLKNNRGVGQDPFYVLWKTSMPSVLVELGFISNSDELAVLKSTSGREALAQALFLSFQKYKTDYDASMSVSHAAPAPKPAAQPKPSVPAPDGVSYGVQIFTVGTKIEEGDPRLLGYKPLIVESGKYYRHIISVEKDRAKCEANFEQILKKYPDAYLVKIDSSGVSRVH